MKHLSICTLGVIVYLGITTAALAVPCRQTAAHGESHRFDCPINLPHGEKNLIVLELNGDFVSTSEDQGYLLAPELQSPDGLLAQMAAEEERELSKGSKQEQLMKRAVIRTFSKTLSSHSGESFERSLDHFFQGYETRMRELGAKPLRTRADIQTSGVGVELWNVAHSIRARFGFGAPLKLGCTAFTVPGAEAADGLHARTLDSDLIESWGKFPVVYLVRAPKKFAYVSTGAAGMVYPGGISGFNEKKISVSLHSLYPTRMYQREKDQRSAVAPYLQQQILEGADSIEAAVKIAKSLHHFSSWAVVVYDAKTQQSATIEVSNAKVEVILGETGRPWAQTNHFRHPEMLNESISPTFKKDLETRSRLSTIESHLNNLEEPASIDWAIRRLSEHRLSPQDTLRSFGETITKVINVMATVAVPGAGELWLTLGDRVPASHGHFVGISVDWEKKEWSVRDALKRNTDYEKAFSNWEESLNRYVEAHLAYRNKEVKRSRMKIEEAISLAQKDKIDDVAYRYLQARLAHLDKDYAAAQATWEWLERQSVGEFQAGLIAIHSAATDLATKADPARIREKLSRAQKNFQASEATYFKHPQLSRLMAMTRELNENNFSQLFELNFETVE